MDFKSGREEETDIQLDSWYGQQLERALKKLIRQVSVLSYTQSARARLSVANYCDRLEDVLRLYAERLSDVYANDTSLLQSAEYLLTLEAHQLLARARELVSESPVHRRQVGNVVELKPVYADLADLEFERLLASSDIPQFLPPATRWLDADDESVDECGMTETGRRPDLTLVYSRNDD